MAGWPGELKRHLYSDRVIMGVGSGGMEDVPPWIFIYGTDIIDRG